MTLLSPGEALSIGLNHQRGGRIDKAEEAFAAAVDADPKNVDALDLLGWMKHQRGNHEEALALFEMADLLDDSQRAPIRVARLNLMAVSLNGLGRSTEAADKLHEARALAPQDHTALLNLGATLLRLGRYGDALEHYREVLGLGLENALVYGNMGVALRHLGRPERAAKLFHQALALAPERAELHHNLGHALRDQGDLPRAAESFRAAARLMPNHPGPLRDLYFVLAKACDWPALERLEERLDGMTDAALEGGELPPDTPTMSVLRCADPERHLAIARNWNRAVLARAALGDGPAVHTAPPLAGHAGERLRIGYLFNDYRNHPVKNLVTALGRHHDRTAFGIFGYSVGLNDTNHLNPLARAAFERCQDIGDLSAREAAETIRRDGIDILIDLSGCSEGHRLDICAHRPAPLQISYAGFPATTGSDFIDYIFCDDVVLPPEDERFFTEHPIRLEHGFKFVPHAGPATGDRPELDPAGKANGHDGFIYCCFAKSHFIDRHAFETWMRVLAAVPDGILWLARTNPSARDNLRAAATRMSVDPERLRFLERAPSKEAHLVRLATADVALDTGRWRDHTAASDALCCGVPVITLRGTHFAARTTESLLHHVGLADLTARDADDFVALAARLAHDPEALAERRRRLAKAGQEAVLFDPPRAVLEIERALRIAWSIHVSGNSPRAIGSSERAG